MPDDLIGVEWSEYDPFAGTLKIGVAFEDGAGHVRTLRGLPPPIDAPLFPDDVCLDVVIGVKDAGAAT